MGHRPHLHLPVPWPDEVIPLSGSQVSHLTKSLRIDPPSEITYTDGEGTMGSGVFDGMAVARGEEAMTPRPGTLTVAVAPPGSRDRQRFLVEKLQEIGVAALVWLKSDFGVGRIPSHQRSEAWAIAALEQSQGAWLLRIDGERRYDELEGQYVVCDPVGGPTAPPRTDTIVIGPEGGWGPGEIDDEVPRWSLGSTVLRVETAAVVAAARLIKR